VLVGSCWPAFETGQVIIYFRPHGGDALVDVPGACAAEGAYIFPPLPALIAVYFFAIFVGEVYYKEVEWLRVDHARHDEIAGYFF